MSSDAFDVKVVEINGTRITLDVLPSNYDDLVLSRSFALNLLQDSLERSCDFLLGVVDDPVQEAEYERRRAKSAIAPLVQALKAHPEWFVDGDWILENVPRFIVSVELIERRNPLSWEELSERAGAIEAMFPNGLTMDRYDEWSKLQWEKLHNYTIVVTVTEPQWAEHLEPGLVFGSTAADWERETGVKLDEAR